MEDRSQHTRPAYRQQERLLEVCTATTDSENVTSGLRVAEWHVPQLGFLLVFLGNRIWSSTLLVQDLFCIRFD